MSGEAILSAENSGKPLDGPNSLHFPHCLGVWKKTLINICAAEQSTGAHSA